MKINPNLELAAINLYRAGKFMLMLEVDPELHVGFVRHSRRGGGSFYLYHLYNN